MPPAPNAAKPVIGLKSATDSIPKAAITHSTKMPVSSAEYAPIRSFATLPVDALHGVDSADPRNRTRLSLGGVVGTFSKGDYIAPKGVVPSSVLARGDGPVEETDEAKAERAVEPTLISRIHAGQSSMHVSVDVGTQAAIRALGQSIPQHVLAGTPQIYFTAPGAEDVLLTPVHPVFREFEARRIRAERRAAGRISTRMGVMPVAGTNSQNAGVSNSINRGVWHFSFAGFSAFGAELSLRAILARMARAPGSPAALADGLLHAAPLPGGAFRRLNEVARGPDTTAAHRRAERIARDLGAQIAEALPTACRKLRWLLEATPELRDHDLFATLPADLQSALEARVLDDAGAAALHAAVLAHVVRSIEHAVPDGEEIRAIPRAVSERIARFIVIPREV